MSRVRGALLVPAPESSEAGGVHSGVALGVRHVGVPEHFDHIARGDALAVRQARAGRQDAVRHAGRLPGPCTDSKHAHLFAHQRRTLSQDLAHALQVGQPLALPDSATNCVSHGPHTRGAIVRGACGSLTRHTRVLLAWHRSPRVIRAIGGALDMQALARLHFTTLAPDEQRAATRRLAVSGHGLLTIAATTGLGSSRSRPSSRRRRTRDVKEIRRRNTKAAAPHASVITAVIATHGQVYS